MNKCNINDERFQKCVFDEIVEKLSDVVDIEYAEDFTISFKGKQGTRVMEDAINVYYGENIREKFDESDAFYAINNGMVNEQLYIILDIWAKTNTPEEIDEIEYVIKEIAKKYNLGIIHFEGEMWEYFEVIDDDGDWVWNIVYDEDNNYDSYKDREGYESNWWDTYRRWAKEYGEFNERM